MTKEFKLYRKKLHFKFKAGTSRGYYTTRDCYFLTIEKNGIITAIGECSPLPGLSAEYTDKQSFESKLEAFVARANYDKNFSLSTLKHESSILFAFESVLLHEDRKSLLLFNNGFTQGKVPIKINGLIWMGDYETMRQRIISKVNSGFKCIKVKIGAIDFIKELELLKLIRSEFSDKDLKIAGNPSTTLPLGAPLRMTKSYNVFLSGVPRVRVRRISFLESKMNFFKG